MAINLSQGFPDFSCSPELIELVNKYMKDGFNASSLAELSANITSQVTIANDIMRSYNFIGVTERMDESIVALQLLLGVGTRDVLRLVDLKRAGSYDKRYLVQHRELPRYLSQKIALLRYPLPQQALL